MSHCRKKKLSLFWFQTRSLSPCIDSCASVFNCGFGVYRPLCSVWAWFMYCVVCSGTTEPSPQPAFWFVFPQLEPAVVRNNVVLLPSNLFISTVSPNKPGNIVFWKLGGEGGDKRARVGNTRPRRRDKPKQAVRGGSEKQWVLRMEDERRQRFWCWLIGKIV